MIYFYKMTIFLFYFYTIPHINKYLKKMHLSIEYVKSMSKASDENDLLNLDHILKELEDMVNFPKNQEKSENPQIFKEPLEKKNPYERHHKGLKEEKTIERSENESKEVEKNGRYTASSEKIGESGGYESPYTEIGEVRKHEFPFDEIKKFVLSSEISRTEEEKMDILKRKSIEDKLLSQKSLSKNSTHISEKETEEFFKIITAKDRLDKNFDFSSVENFAKIGILSKKDIEKINNEYPLYLGPKIDFENLDKPFGVNFQNYKSNPHTELKNILFFDNFMTIDLNEFLKKTYVGNLSLEKIKSLYKLNSIRFLSYNANVLEFLNLNFNVQDVLKNIPLYVSEYLEKIDPPICDFTNKKIGVINETNKNNKFFLENVRKFREGKYISENKKKKIDNVITYTKRNLNYVKRTLNTYSFRSRTIQGVISNFIKKISSNNDNLTKDDAIISSLHYVLNYSIEFIKPLYTKIKNKKSYDSNEFRIMAGKLNSLIDLMEFLEHNSKLYNDFYTILKNIGRYCPRITSEASLMSFYNYITLKVNIISILYNICKIFLKVYLCKGIKRNYMNNRYPQHRKLLLDLQTTLNDALLLIQ